MSFRWRLGQGKDLRAEKIPELMTEYMEETFQVPFEQFLHRGNPIHSSNQTKPNHSRYFVTASRPSLPSSAGMSGVPRCRLASTSWTSSTQWWLLVWNRLSAGNRWSRKKRKEKFNICKTTYGRSSPVQIKPLVNLLTG